MRVPTLKHDTDMLTQYARRVSPNGRLERKIVFALIEHLTANGFRPWSVWDGEDETRVKTAKDAMELIFNLDEASLRIAKVGTSKWHGVLLVLGNGEEIISDWNYTASDPDGFNAAMESFVVPEVR